MTKQLKMAIFLRLTVYIFVNPIAIGVLSHEFGQPPRVATTYRQLITGHVHMSF